jgi:hypothetical protein
MRRHARELFTLSSTGCVTGISAACTCPAHDRTEARTNLAEKPKTPEGGLDPAPLL